MQLCPKKNLHGVWDGACGVEVGGKEEARLGGADGGTWVGSEVGTEGVETSGALCCCGGSRPKSLNIFE